MHRGSDVPSDVEAPFPWAHYGARTCATALHADDALTPLSYHHSPLLNAFSLRSSSNSPPPLSSTSSSSSSSFVEDPRDPISSSSHSHNPHTSGSHIHSHPRARRHSLSHTRPHAHRHADASLPMHVSPSQSSHARPAWTPGEDARLRQAIAQHGEKQWAAIANEVGSRDAASCYQRWNRVLKTSIRRDPFSHEEMYKLAWLVRRLGARNFSAIAKQMPGRTDGMLFLCS